VVGDPATARPEPLHRFGATFQAHAHRWPVAAVVALALAVVAVLALTVSRAPEEPAILAVDLVGDAPTITWLYPATALWDAGIRPGDRIVSLDAQPVDPSRLREQVRQARTIEVQSAASGLPIVAEREDPQTLRAPLSRWSFAVTATCFAAVGLLVFLLSRQLRPAVGLLMFGADTALLLLASLATPFGVPWALAVVLMSMLGFGFSTLTLFVLFPVDQTHRAWARWAVRIAAAASLAVAALYVVAVRDPTVYPFVLRAMLSVVSLELVIAVGVVITAWRASALERRAIGLIMLGLAAGVAPFVLFSALPFLIRGAAVVPPELSIVAISLMPVSFGVLILRRQFPGIERPARRGAVAFLVWAVLLTIFGIATTLVEDIAPTQLDGALAEAWPLVLIALVAATFPVLQRRARTALERRLFHDVYDFAPTVQALTAELNRLHGVSALADATLDQLVQTLDLTWACILVHESTEHHRRYSRVRTQFPGRGSEHNCDDACIDRLSEDQLIRRAALCIQLFTEEHVQVGLLAVGPKQHDVELQAEDMRLVETVASVVAPVLRNALLLAELAKQVDVLASRERQLATLSLRVMRVAEEERRRLAADLHDEPMQRIVLLLRDLRSTEQFGADLARDRAGIQRLRDGLNDVVGSLGAICAGLRPLSLEDFGLAVALESLVASVSARVDNAEISYEPAEDLLDVRFPPDLEVAMYRAAQEGLNNSLKHGRPTAIRLSLTGQRDGLELVVSDDGGSAAADASSEVTSGGYGLLGIRERLTPWRGTVNLEHEGGNTVLRVFVPLNVAEYLRNAELWSALLPPL